MKENWEQSFALMLKSEGGYSNDPHDPGGMTNLGVTHIDWAKWIGREPTEAEMRALTPADVMPLYKKWYWDKVWGDNLPSGVDYAVFDFGVNSGIGRAIRCLQSIVGADEDGVMGPKTMTALSQRDPVHVTEQVCEERLQFLQSLKTWTYFGKGWGARVASVGQLAAKMAAA
jgi:hypothetical protein